MWCENYDDLHILRKILFLKHVYMIMLVVIL